MMRRRQKTRWDMSLSTWSLMVRIPLLTLNPLKKWVSRKYKKRTRWANTDRASLKLEDLSQKMSKKILQRVCIQSNRFWKMFQKWAAAGVSKSSVNLLSGPTALIKIYRTSQDRWAKVQSNGKASMWLTTLTPPSVAPSGTICQTTCLRQSTSKI